MVNVRIVVILGKWIRIEGGSGNLWMLLKMSGLDLGVKNHHVEEL